MTFLPPRIITNRNPVADVSLTIQPILTFGVIGYGADRFYRKTESQVAANIICSFPKKPARAVKKAQTVITCRVRRVAAFSLVVVTVFVFRPRCMTCRITISCWGHGRYFNCNTSENLATRCSSNTAEPDDYSYTSKWLPPFDERTFML